MATLWIVIAAVFDFGDGFAARVRAGDDERVGLAAELDGDRHHGLLVDERVPRVFQPNHPPVRPDGGTDAVDFKGILRLGENDRQIGQHTDAGHRRRRRPTPTARRECGRSRAFRARAAR